MYECLTPRGGCEQGISPYSVECKPEMIKLSGLKQPILDSFSIKILYIYIDGVYE